MQKLLYNKDIIGIRKKGDAMKLWNRNLQTASI